MLNEYKNKIEVQKEVLLSLPRNNNKNEKIYQAKIGELLEELQKEKEVVASEIRKRRDRYLSLEHDKSIDLLTKEIDLLLPSIHLLNNYNSSYEKSGLDIILYELGHFYKTDLEKVNKDIIKVLTIFSTVGVTLTEEDFNYSYYSDKYMRKILLQSTSEEELKKHFEEIYWKCPNIITHITLNLKYLYYKNKKKFDLYYENKVKELEDRNIIEAYKELYIEREQKVKNDAYLLQGSFLEGKLNIGDYTLDKINKAYKSVIDYFPTEKVNSDILKLYHSLIEYKNYLEFNYIINDIKELYKERDKYKNIYKFLTFLNLNDNCISILKLKGYNFLETLQASNNQISVVEIDLPALRILDLSKNNIKKMFEFKKY